MIKYLFWNWVYREEFLNYRITLHKLWLRNILNQPRKSVSLDYLLVRVVTSVILGFSNRVYSHKKFCQAWQFGRFVYNPVNISYVSLSLVICQDTVPPVRPQMSPPKNSLSLSLFPSRNLFPATGNEINLNIDTRFTYSIVNNASAVLGAK